MQVDLLGAVTVTGPGGSVTGHALGGRRARLVVAALALSGGPVSADRLADVLWPDERPTTWPVALRGVVRSLRTALAPARGDGDPLIETTPAGYALAAGTTVDALGATASIRSAQTLVDAGSYGAAIDLLEPIAGRRGNQLLPEEDSAWIAEHRAAVDAASLWATELLVVAAGRSSDGQRGVAAARAAVAAYPLEERAHRSLIAALDQAGDRAAAVRAYESCRSLLAEQLGVDPSPATVAVYLEALADQPTATRATVPSYGTTFVGRADEQAGLLSGLTAARLVSVTGAGGVGKSRLVAQLAQIPSVRATYLGGRLWVSLGTVSEDALVAPAVALAVVPNAVGGDTVGALARHLAPLGPVLLVLDGVEAVIDGAASLVSALLAACPTLSIVVTSRVPLSIDDEHVVAVEGLPDEAPVGGALEASDQVRLLRHRVRDAGGELTLGPDTMPLVVALLRRCGGLPLAIEIAAAQLAAMSLPDLLDHLAEAVDGDDPLAAVARSSYLLLDDDEAAVFRRLAVLDGPVTLPMVRAVVADEGIPAVRVVRLLRELTVRGLLTVDRSGPRWRYRQDDDLRRLAGRVAALAWRGDRDLRAAGRDHPGDVAGGPEGGPGVLPGRGHRRPRSAAVAAGRGDRWPGGPRPRAGAHLPAAPLLGGDLGERGTVLAFPAAGGRRAIGVGRVRDLWPGIPQLLGG